MKHDELIAVLGRMTDVLERVEKSNSELKATNEQLIEKIEGIETVLATWDYDQKNRERVLGEAIERNRKAVVEDIRPRIKRLEEYTGIARK